MSKEVGTGGRFDIFLDSGKSIYSVFSEDEWCAKLNDFIYQPV